MVAIFGLGSVLVIGVSIFGGDGSGSAQDEITPDPGIEQIAVLTTAVAEDPSDVESAALLATILANSGQAAESLTYFDIAVAGDPENGSLRLNYGIALYRTGNLFDAEVQLLKAYSLEEEKAGTAYYLGQLYENQENPDLDEAIQWYEKVIEIGPEDSLVAGQAQERLEAIEASATPTAE